MHTIEVHATGARAEFPSCWEELTNEQFDYIMQRVILFMDGKISHHDFQIQVLFHFLNLKFTPRIYFKEKKMKKDELEEKYSNISRLAGMIDFLFVEKFDMNKKKKVLEFNFTSVKNYIPELEAGGKMYVGPADALTDISFAEYRYACDQFKQFSENNEFKYLNRLIAALYRPERPNYQSLKHSIDYDGQRKEKFNQHLIDRRAEEMEKIPFYKRFAIYLWFRNCLGFLSSGVIRVSGNEVDLGILYDKENKDSKDDLGHAGTLFRMADEGTFGNIRETDDTGLYDILLKLYQMKKDYDEFKRHNKSNNP